MTAYESIFEEINKLHIIDTHEHLPGDESKRDQDGDLFTEFLFHYFDRDMVSAGLPRPLMDRVRNERGNVLERWAIIEPFWRTSRFTGYGRSLELSARGIYGVPAIRHETIEELYDRFMEGMRPGHFEYVLKEKSKINVSIVDSDPACDRRFFRSVLRADRFSFPEYAEDLYLESEGRWVRSFSDWLDACDRHIDEAAKNGCVACKNSMAYTRSLTIEDPSYTEAERAFNAFSSARSLPDWLPRRIKRTKAFEDFMLHHIMQRLIENDLPLQIHTGFLEGNCSDLRKANPLNLIPTIVKYPDLTFILMHGGYPWHDQIMVMAKTFPNVNLEMSWLHIVSPNAAQVALSEWLDTLPYNKICAFGGDYHFIDGVYGHQVMARQNVAAVLANKIDRGIFGLDDGVEIARHLFVKNPYEIFRLKRSGVEA